MNLVPIVVEQTVVVRGHMTYIQDCLRIVLSFWEGL